MTTGRLDFDGTGSGALSNGSSRREVEEVAAFCEMASGCRKELLYSHFDFHFDPSRCVRNCNCGVPLEAATELLHYEEVSAKRRVKVVEDDTDDGIPKGAIEYQYQKILAESKRLSLPKREAMSRRLVRVRSSLMLPQWRYSSDLDMFFMAYFLCACLDRTFSRRNLCQKKRWQVCEASGQ